jgi:hypothetical protein
LLALAGLLAFGSGLAWGPAAARADASVEVANNATSRVLIRLPERPDALLEEALVRVRGELSAMGLSADERLEHVESPQSPPTFDADVAGALFLTRDGSLIRIRAFGPASASVSQELDARASDITPEVVAVRAVEALRAVMLRVQKPPEAPPKPKQVPPPPAKPKALPPQPPPPVSPPPSVAPRGRGALSVWAGPSAEYDVASRTLGAGASVSVLYGSAPCFAGPALGTTLLDHKLRDASGYVLVKRSSAALRAGCALRLWRSLEAWAAVVGGGALYAVEGHANPGFIGKTGHHLSPVLGGALGLTLFVSRLTGLYAEVDGSFASNTPGVVANHRDLANMERPLLSAGLGLVILAPF